ncbi:MAG: 2OG-Fe(II) oxygenase [Microthrixaceae bacterium]|nr:2OG-Fe(II) oxygenase [Microthrixaceae bacterium]
MVSLDGRPLLVPPSAPPYQGYQLHAGVFTPRQCRRIVDLAHGMRLDDALLEGVAGAEIADEGIRRSRTAWIPPTDESWWIYDKLAKVVAKANRTYRFDLTGFAEDLQFTAYDEPGAFYGWHQDGLDGAVAVRKLSIVVQLTSPDEYEGGELQFFEVLDDDDDERFEEFTVLSRELGTAIVFPSFEYHRVMPIRSGARHSLVSWVSGPPFR